jgi:monoterpene epsilon-lactone hydrolase
VDSLGLALRIIWTIVAATARRLSRGPRLPGWPFLFELAVAVARRVVEDGVDLPAEVIRRRFVGARIARKIRSRVSRSSTRLAGRPAETFTPTGWTDGDPTILYLHGGGYIMGSPATHRDLIARIALAAGARAFAVEYRKAPEHPFPAAAEDCEAAFGALLAAPVPSDRLFLAGDSSGGGLALAVALRARDAGLLLPRALLLISPWTSLEVAGESVARNAPFDYLTPRALQRAAHDYAPGGDAAASVMSASFEGLPPLLIQTGGAELLLSDNQALAARAASAGVRVVHEVEENMVHVFPAFCSVLPRQGEAAIARVGDFVRRASRSSVGAPTLSSQY